MLGAGFDFRDHRQLLLLKQHLLQLLRRADVERVAGEIVNFLLEPDQPLPILPAQFPQAIDVDPDAIVLHLGQHVDQRQLKLVEQFM